MEEIVEEVHGNLNETAKRSHEEAVEFYDKLGAPFGNIRLIGGRNPEIMESSSEDLATWNGDNLNSAYGIDASVTQERKFTNGLKVAISNAKAGVVGDGIHSFTDKSHIVAVIYDKYDNTSLTSKTVKNQDDIIAELNVLTEEDPRESKRMVQNIARTKSEGEHLKRLIQSSISSVVFLDGPIYPPLILDEVVRRDFIGEEDAWNDVLGNILSTYVESITTAMDSNWPIIGVVKTMDSRSLIKDLELKLQELYSDGDFPTTPPWEKDIHFLTDLLYSENIGTYTYTSWFEEKKRFSNSTNKDGSHYVKPLKNCPEVKYSLESYNRAFFFVRIPSTDTVARVEVPSGFVQDSKSQEFVQKRALAEIAKMGDTAEPILQADKNAKIGRKNQKKLFSKLYGKLSEPRDYNSDYRGPEYTGENN